MAKNMTALMIASWRGNIKIVKDLIEAGADINARLVNCRTALILAAEQGQSECVEILIEAGADVNITVDINLPRSNRMKSIQEGSYGNQMSSKQLGHSHHLQAKNGDEASENCGKKAAVSTPTPSIVIKRELQEILGNYGDGSDNDRHSDVRCNANSSPGKRRPIELPSARNADSISSSHLMKSTNLRKTLSPENRNENPIGRDFSSARIAPSTAPGAAPTTGKTLTEVQNSLTIPPVLRKVSTKSSAAPKNPTVAKLLARLAEKPRAVRKYPAIAPAMGHFSAMRKAAALMQPLTIPPTIGQYPTVTPTIGQYPTVTPTIGQYPTVTPTIGQYPTVTPTIGQYPTVTPTIGQYPTVTPTIGQYPTVTPTIGQYPTVTPTIGQYPTVTPTIGQYPTVTPTVSQATGRFSTVGKPPKVFLKIVAAAENTQSVYRVVSPGVFLEMPPVTTKSSIAVPAVSTITTTVPGTIPTVVPEFWSAPVGTTTPAVAPAVKKNPAVNAASGKAQVVGKDTVEIPLDLLKKVSSFENIPAGRKKPSSPVFSTGAPAIFPAETRAKAPSVQTAPTVSAGTAAVFPPETRAKVSAGAPGVFPPKTQAVVPSVQTTPAIVSAGSPGVFPPGTQAVVSVGVPAVFSAEIRAEAPSMQTAPTTPEVFPTGTRAKVSTEAPGVFPPKTQAVAPSVQTAPTIVSAGAPAVFPPGTGAKVPAGFQGVFPAGTRAKAHSVKTTPTIDSAAVEDELIRRNSSIEESPRNSRTLAISDSGDRHRRYRSRSRSDDSSVGDWLVHKKRRRTSPVKVKQEPTGGDENDVDMKSETRGTDAATVDDSGHDNSNNHNSDSSVKIKEEPNGSDEKYVGMNSKNNDKRINESSNNDNVYTEDWFARVLSRYLPSSFLRSTSTSPSTYPSSLFGHGEKSCSDKGRRHHQKRHHRSESKGEDSPAAKRKKKKKKKKDRESPPVNVKQEPTWW